MDEPVCTSSPRGPFLDHSSSAPCWKRSASGPSCQGRASLYVLIAGVLGPRPVPGGQATALRRRSARLLSGNEFVLGGYLSLFLTRCVGSHGDAPCPTGTLGRVAVRAFWAGRGHLPRRAANTDAEAQGQPRRNGSSRRGAESRASAIRSRRVGPCGFRRRGPLGA
jgi:hypothetical protein